MFRIVAVRLALVLAGGLVAAGGLPAQAKTAGDTGASYVTLDGYGVGEVVPGSLAGVTARARATMIKMKIVEEPARRPGRGWRALRGKKGTLDVVIRLKFKSASTTRVEVDARRGPAKWDADFARQVIDEIKRAS